MEEMEVDMEEMEVEMEVEMEEGEEMEVEMEDEFKTWLALRKKTDDIMYIELHGRINIGGSADPELSTEIKKNFQIPMNCVFELLKIYSLSGMR
jgi:hypothetical protein